MPMKLEHQAQQYIFFLYKVTCPTLVKQVSHMQWQMKNMSIKTETRQDQKEKQVENTVTEMRITLDGSSE